MRSVVFLGKFLDGRHEVSQIDGLTTFVSPGLYAVPPRRCRCGWLPTWMAYDALRSRSSTKRFGSGARNLRRAPTDGVHTDALLASAAGSLLGCSYVPTPPDGGIRRVRCSDPAGRAEAAEDPTAHRARGVRPRGGTSFFEYGEDVESFEHYFAEMQDRQEKRGRLAVVNGCRRGYRRFKLIVLGPDMLWSKDALGSQ